MGRAVLPLCVRLAAYALLAVACPAAAQTVRVQAIEAETRRPIPGAIVALIDSLERRLAQGLTSESGRLQLRAPGPGTYRLRADRIGHPGVLSLPVTLTDTVSVLLVMPVERLLLPELAFTGFVGVAMVWFAATGFCIMANGLYWERAAPPPQDIAAGRRAPA
jgi:hypothetical protein